MRSVTAICVSHFSEVYTIPPHSRAVAQSMRDAQRSKRQESPTPTTGQDQELGKSTNLNLEGYQKERTKWNKPEHLAGKASTTMLRACLPPSNAMAPLVRSSLAPH